jgi:RHS repeat-associated protein
MKGAVINVYDGDGNRVSETIGGTTTKFLVDSLNPTGYPQVLDETVNGSVTRTYAYGQRRISENQLIGSTWTPSFYGYDGHGSVRFLTNAAGAVTDSYTYDAFGMPITTTGTTPNSFQYSGEQFDNALGLYYLRARYFNAATGRFLTMDPYEGCILNCGTLHKYVYTQNNPVNRIDPTGLADAEEEGALDANFLRYVRNFKKWADPAARARICATVALLRASSEGLDPDAAWAVYIACILKNSAPFN